MQTRVTNRQAAVFVVWLFCVVVALSLPTLVLAQSPGDPGFVGPVQTSDTIQLPNPIGITDPRVLVGRIIGAALGIIGSIAFVIFLWGGFLWMTSAGNQEKVTKGKNVILWAAIGLAVIFTSYALVTFVLKGLKVGQQATPPGGQQATPPKGQQVSPP